MEILILNGYIQAIIDYQRKVVMVSYGQLEAAVCHALTEMRGEAFVRKHRNLIRKLVIKPQ